jgi:HSP20 family molecular chaperone IbpA
VNVKKITHSDNGYSKNGVIYGKFMRNFTLPSYLDAENVAAKYKDGVLTILSK